MPKKFLAIDDTTTLEAFPFESPGGLVERLTSAETITELGISGGGVFVKDEGVDQPGTLDAGAIDTFDFVGAGVTASVTGTTATITVTSGGMSSGEAMAVSLL